jgi:phage gp36-like protein
MAYWTQTQFEDFVSVNIVSDLPADEVAGRIPELQVRSDGEVDGYIAGRVAVPMANPTALIVLCSMKIAYYYLVAVFPHVTDQEKETAREFYDDSILTLRDIAKKVIPLDDGSIVPFQNRLVTNASALPKRHTHTNPSGQGTDNQFTFGDDEREP